MDKWRNGTNDRYNNKKSGCKVEENCPQFNEILPGYNLSTLVKIRFTEFSSFTFHFPKLSFIKKKKKSFITNTHIWHFYIIIQIINTFLTNQISSSPRYRKFKYPECLKSRMHNTKYPIRRFTSSRTNA